MLNNVGIFLEARLSPRALGLHQRVRLYTEHYGVVHSPAMSRKDTIYTRREVEDLIAQGRSIVILDGKVLKVDPWLRFHPGGDKAIMHMVGRDATDEINA